MTMAEITTMEQGRRRRSSRLPTPRFPFCRRRPGLSISGPIGPVQHNRFAVSWDHDDDYNNDNGDGDEGGGCRRRPTQEAIIDTEKSWASELSSSRTMSTIVHHDGAELPSRPTTPVATRLENPSPTWPLLPKSCTLNVFSGLSKSLSHSSLVSSRCADTSSSTSSFSGTTNDKKTSFPSLVLQSSSSHANSSHIPVVRRTSVDRRSLGPITTTTKPEQPQQQQQHPLRDRDPCIIYEAQPSAYWTGRFMALRDKFRAEESFPPKNNPNTQSPLGLHEHTTGRVNPPPTALSQQQQEQRQRRKTQDDNITNMKNNNNNKDQQQQHRHRFSARLPPSATSAAVLQQTTSSSSSSKMLRRAPNAQLLLRTNTNTNTDDDDEDKRCRRVLVHLEALCATDEARESLRVWQRGYARETGRKKLLPEGDGGGSMRMGMGTMDEEGGGRDGGCGGESGGRGGRVSYFARIIGGGRRVGKRASIM